MKTNFFVLKMNQIIIIIIAIFNTEIKITYPLQYAS